jgi:hypothetical protein
MVQTASHWPLIPLHPSTPARQSVLQKVTINIGILLSPAEKSVFMHSQTEAETEVEATYSVSEVIYIECNYSKIPLSDSLGPEQVADYGVL